MAIQVHQLVFDGRVPSVNNRCLSSWAKLRPNFEIRAWQNEDIRVFVGSTHPIVKELVTRARNFGEASDILRIAIVYEFGGIYTDWDIYLLSPDQFVKQFNALGENGALFLKDYKNSDAGFGAIITHSFFYSEPKNHLLKSFLQRIGENYRNKPNEMTIHVTGPHAFTRFLLDNGWNLDTPQFVEQNQFFRHDYDMASTQSDKDKFLEREIRTCGRAPLVNLWTNCWIDNSANRVITKRFPILRSWSRDPFRTSMEYILSERHLNFCDGRNI